MFGSGLAIIVALYWLTKLSRTVLFWAAFILTRPLGATVGDLLDKPHEQGGLGFGRFTASAALAAFILICILIVPQRAGSHGASDLAARDRSLS